MTSLLRAKDLRGLLRARPPGHPGCLPWLLLHPLTNPVFHDEEGAHPVDALSAGQFGPIPHQEGRSSEEAEKLWMDRVIGFLAYQYQDVAKTRATAMVWGRCEPVAVLGVIAESAFPGIQAVNDDYAEALFRIHQTENLRQEMTALRHIIAAWRQPFLVVRGDGSIVAGTEAGWDGLHAYMSRRPSRKSPILQLPAAMVSALVNGCAIQLGKVDVTVSVLPDMERETTWPLFTVTLSPKPSTDAPSLEGRLRTLTRSQRAVYGLMVSGYRNKEIAAQLGVSHHTIVHHVTAVLAKMACPDRLQLMAAAAQSAVQTELVAPPMIADAPTKPDLKVAVAPRQAR